MKHLFVWVRLPTAEIRLAGELATTNPAPGSGRFESEFEYAPEWLDDPHSFPLDPVSLTFETRGRRFQSQQFYPPLGVFEDALPDDWGRRLLAAAALRFDGRKSTPADMLLRMHGGGTGALVFSETPEPPKIYECLSSIALPVLLSAAERFDAGELPPGDDFRKLLDGSSRAGGARPKALIRDATGEWLAKFPSRVRDGAHDVIGLEATCLELARRAGLAVPDSHLQSVGRKRRVLMVRRFDVTAQNGRVHMVSMSTLCRERPGIHALDYSSLQSVLSKHSAAPSEDVAALFRHMTLNAAIGNVDDHLKNFWMVSTPAGYRLAPAFDLVPDIAGRGEHTLLFQSSFGCPTRGELIDIANAWRVSGAAEIIDRVCNVVGDFVAVARDLGVREGSALKQIAGDIQQRRRRLSA